VIYHRYDGRGNWLMPYMAVRDLELRRILLGWVGDVSDQPLLLYNDVIGRVEFDEILPIVGQMSVCCDPFPYCAYGRFPIECAALGVPCITSDRVATGSILYPTCTVDPYDVRGIRARVIRLFSDIEFWEATAAYAYEHATFYNLEQSRHRFLTALEEHRLSVDGGPLRCADPAPPWIVETILR
jgi:glycosyltransferase involved in cell wall biosynthesis